MLNLIAAVVVAVSLTGDNAYRWCFNATYSQPVTAEDGSTITCPASYYR